MPPPTIIYNDIDVSLNPNPISGDVLQQTGVAAIIQSVADLVQIGHYEKPFHPEVGGNMRALLFELADPLTASQIQNELENIIGNFEPRVSLIAVIVEVVSDGHGYNVTIEFSIASIPNPVSISTFLERLR